MSEVFSKSASYRDLASDRSQTLRDTAPYGAMFVTLIIYMIVEFVRPQQFFGPLAAIRPGLLAAIPLIVFSFGRLRDAPYKDTLIKLLFAFIFLGAVSVLFATNNRFAFNMTKTVFLHVFAAIIPMCVLISNELRLRKLMYAWIAIYVYLAVYGILHAGRGPGSFIVDENDLALALNCALPYAYFIYQCKGSTKKVRLLSALALVVILCGVVSTMSRGGFVGLAVTSCALIWLSRNRIRNAVVLLFAAALFAAFIPSEYKEEIVSIGDTQDNTRNERFDSWERGWEMFVDYPILGIGFGNYPWRVAAYDLASGDTAYRRGLGGRVAHSVYFTLLPETGLAGTLIFICVAVGIYRRHKRTLAVLAKTPPDASKEFIESLSRASVVSLLAFLSTGAFISVLYYPEFWYTAGFAYVIHSNAAKLAAAETSSKARDGEPVTAPSAT